MKNSGPDYITIGKVLGIWGNKGKLKVKMLTDFSDRFKPGSEVLIGREPAIIESEFTIVPNIIFLQKIVLIIIHYKIFLNKSKR